MAERDRLISGFLTAAGWGAAARCFLAGDASARSYQRLINQTTGKSAVLMDAPPHKGERTQPFIDIANHLLDLGFSAPNILASDQDNGLILLEDLGDDLFARLCQSSPDMEVKLYSGAIDLLAGLHQSLPPNSLPNYGPKTYLQEAELIPNYYLPAALGQDPAQILRAEYARLITAICTPIKASVMVLRDYHAENLLWLPTRQGLGKIGLLDFQDALIGHPAYDLVSLLKDARRDTTAKLQSAMIDRYLAAIPQPRLDFLSAYARLGAQRNLKIIGIFTRLWIRDGKPGYLDLIPRVWAHLLGDLSHPDLADLKEFIQHHIPAPSPEILTAIRGRRDES